MQGNCISLGGQLKNHWVTVSRIIKKLGNNYSATQYLNKCLYSVGIGNNDYINNYFMPKNYNTSHQYTPEQYARVLIRQYSRQIEVSQWFRCNIFFHSFHLNCNILTIPDQFPTFLSFCFRLCTIMEQGSLHYLEREQQAALQIQFLYMTRRAKRVQKKSTMRSLYLTSSLDHQLII